MKSPRRENPQTWEAVVSGCQGLGENRYSVSPWGDENVLELDCDDSCTT